MVTTERNKTYTLEADEKATPVMVYTKSYLAWGEVVTKEVIRLSTWLRTQAAPQYIYLHDAQSMYVGGGSAAPLSFAELHVPTSEVMAFHMLPPHQDPVDYDPNEPNRKLEPVTALVGYFRFDGLLRMSSQNSLNIFLEINKETYTSLYDVKVTQPQRPSMSPLHLAHTLLRREVALFASQRQDLL